MMRAIHRLRHVGGLFVALVFALSLPLAAHAVTNTWSAAGSLTTARDGHTATLLPSGQVLVAGGADTGGNALASAERYDPATNTWSAAASLTTARKYHTATRLPSGQVLVAGGRGNTGLLASAERYDPATNTWSAAGSLTTARYGHTATLLPSGQVLVAGGDNYSSGYLASAELYDPATNTWSAAGSLTTGRYVHTATRLPSGQVLVAGGVGNSGYLGSAELYDPVTNTWSGAASLTTARGWHTATLLPSGQVLVAGGLGVSGDLASAERYDPATNTWSAAGSLTTARDSHTATLLPSGQVLVAGGLGFPSGAVFASAELYDPATNTWSGAASLTTARGWHTATLLPSGQVLVAGGLGVSGDLASAELYTPEGSGTFNLDQHGLTGAWYNPATGGQGFLIESYPDLVSSGHGYLAMGWYTFDVTAAGGQRWYILQGDAVNGSASAPLTIYAATGGNFNAPPQITSSNVGTATLSFSSCTSGTLSFNFNDGRSGSIPLTRLDTNITCSNAGDDGNATSNYLLSGAWYDSATSGQGIIFDVNPTQTTLFAAWYTYAPNGSSIGGGASQRWYTIQDNAFAPGTLSKDGLAIYETTGGTFNTPGGTSTTQVGTADVSFQSCTALTLTYNFTGGTNAGQSGSITLSRVVDAPAGCQLGGAGVAPAGTTVDASTGVVTIPATAAVGTYVFPICVIDSTGQSACSTATAIVNPATAAAISGVHGAGKLRTARFLSAPAVSDGVKLHQFPSAAPANVIRTANSAIHAATGVASIASACPPISTVPLHINPVVGAGTQGRAFELPGPAVNGGVPPLHFVASTLGVTANVTLCQPANLSDTIVVTNVMGSGVDGNLLLPTDALYVDWAVVNNGTGPTVATFYTDVYVDGAFVSRWPTNAPLAPGNVRIQSGVPIGTLPAGPHTIVIIPDATNAVDPAGAADNNIVKNFTVVATLTIAFSPDNYTVAQGTSLDLPAPNVAGGIPPYQNFAFDSSGSGNGNPPFDSSIESLTGVVTISSNALPGSYTFDVCVDDSGGQQACTPVTVTVTGNQSYMGLFNGSHLFTGPDGNGGVCSVLISINGGTMRIILTQVSGDGAIQGSANFSGTIVASEDTCGQAGSGAPFMSAPDLPVTGTTSNLTFDGDLLTVSGVESLINLSFSGRLNGTTILGTATVTIPGANGLLVMPVVLQ
jgi:N-acetylneuraminic acid mutarotase